ncbi:hypothetical protein [Pseudorhodoplanes sp.]|uniref:hypothetical protein n=1 Tax=Pseudorhodoplanes sp. TaxID=1934341 RepID=UPI00391AB160
MNKLLPVLAAGCLAVALSTPVQAETRTKLPGITGGQAQALELSAQRRHYHRRHYGPRRVYHGPRRVYRRAYWGPRRVYWAPRRAYWGPRYGYWRPAPVWWGPAPVVWAPRPVVFGPRPVVWGGPYWGGPVVTVGFGPRWGW